MVGGHERRTKRRFDSGGANQDESGSSRPDVISGRELRPSERKRAAVADIVEESEGGSSSDEDDVEDSPYTIESRHGTAPVQENSSEDEEAAGGYDEEDEEEEMNQEDLSFPTIREPIRFGCVRCVDYSASGMTREVKRWRKIDPYSLERTSTDPRFHTKEQHDFYESVIIRDRKIAVDAQWVDWNSMEKANDPLFQEIMSECESQNIKALMGFQKDWNKEVIA